LMLLEHHTRGCVVRALREGGGDADSAVSELTDVMRRFIR
jgi:DNA-binding FrmR family transcriptional regulator